MSLDTWRQMLELTLASRGIPIVNEVLAHVNPPEVTRPVANEDYHRIMSTAVEGYVVSLRRHYNKLLEETQGRLEVCPTCGGCKPTSR